jgi:cobalt/nickel transport protein
MSRLTSFLLIGAAALIIALPMILGIEGEYAGTDSIAQAAIEASNPDMKPWAEVLWAPPSKEIESLLFALQAAIGAGLIGYVIGRRHGARGDGASRRPPMSN